MIHLLIPIPRRRMPKAKLIWSIGKGWSKDFILTQEFKKPNLYEPVTKSRMFAKITFERYSEPMQGTLDIVLTKTKNKLFKIVKRNTKAILDTPFLLTVRQGRKKEHHLIKLRTYQKRRSTKNRIYIYEVNFDELDNIEFLKLIEKTRTRFEKKKKRHGRL